jgi:hypothetical protein
MSVGWQLKKGHKCDAALSVRLLPRGQSGGFGNPRFAI